MPYVALSYVWGPSLDPPEYFAKLEGKSSESVLWKLPNTIEDAIEATLRLDYRYLWVDRYCIDQSNPTEVQSQVSKMGMIYQAATMMFISVDGADSNFGLPGVGPRPQHELLSISH